MTKEMTGSPVTPTPQVYTPFKDLTPNQFMRRYNTVKQSQWTEMGIETLQRWDDEVRRRGPEVREQLLEAIGEMHLPHELLLVAKMREAQALPQPTSDPSTSENLGDAAGRSDDDAGAGSGEVGAREGSTVAGDAPARNGGEGAFNESERLRTHPRDGGLVAKGIDNVWRDVNRLGDCAGCGAAQDDRPAIFRGECWCSDVCRKWLRDGGLSAAASLGETRRLPG